jgi:hypothetical protein
MFGDAERAGCDLDAAAPDETAAVAGGAAGPARSGSAA